MPRGGCLLPLHEALQLWGKAAEVLANSDPESLPVATTSRSPMAQGHVRLYMTIRYYVYIINRMYKQINISLILIIHDLFQLS